MPRPGPPSLFIVVNLRVFIYVIRIIHHSVCRENTSVFFRVRIFTTRPKKVEVCGRDKGERERGVFRLRAVAGQCKGKASGNRARKIEFYHIRPTTQKLWGTFNPSFNTDSAHTCCGCIQVKEYFAPEHSRTRIRRTIQSGEEKERKRRFLEALWEVKEDCESETSYEPKFLSSPYLAGMMSVCRVAAAGLRLSTSPISHSGAGAAWIQLVQRTGMKTAGDDTPDTHDDFKPVVKSENATHTVQEHINKDITENPVMVYMKGVPEAPQCGFSAMVVRILAEYGVAYIARNVLADPALREGIKQYSRWPTIPQVFINGEFVGGSDILISMHRSGELEDLLKQATGKDTKET